MEKIYEENQQSQKQKKISFSIVLSFAVALFAVVSLIAVGFNQISYAAPITTETVTLHRGKFGSNIAWINAKNASGNFMVPLLFADSDDATTATQPLFCIEQGVDTVETSYNSEGEIIDDLGLVYILNRSSVLGGSGIVTGDIKYPATHSQAGTSLSAEDRKYVEMYATQIAVWMYLKDVYSATSADPKEVARHGKLEVPQTTGGVQNSYTPLDIITSTVNLELNKTGTTDTVIYSGNIYETYVKNVVTQAKSGVSYKTVRASLASENISKVDNDTYETDKITVVAEPSSDLVNYSVDLTGIDGAYIVDKDGNKKSGLDTFAPGDYFKVRVPINKVTSTTNKVDIVIVGEFNNYLSGEYFVATGSQSVVGVTREHFRVANKTSINFLVAPDTGMSTAQTIYFIGLIVLLCGVGIIYANAKPVEEK